MIIEKMSSAILILSILSAHLIDTSNAANILYIYHLGYKSTVSMHQAVSKILISDGHKITAISALPMTEEMANYTDLKAHDDFIVGSDAFSMEDNLLGTYANRKYLYESNIVNCEHLYQNTEVARQLENIKIDLVLLEIDGAECYLPYVAKFQVPIIGITTGYFLFPDFDGKMGNPVNPSYVPIPFSGLGKQMGFFQRIHNLKEYLLHMVMDWYYTREAESVVNKYMESPPIAELFERISLVFCNNHFSFLAKPTAPTTVDIAGIHIENNTKPLPKDIQTFIDTAPEGVIYLSLGSVAAFSQLPTYIHESFVNIIKKLPYRVIWRHDKPEMVPSMENVIVQKWLPQKDILAHPKVIMFISHSGIYSTYEAIYFGKPMLTFPVLYDQPTNAAIIQSSKIGIPLDLYNFDEQALRDAIDELVQDTTYRENMKKLSAIFKDRPLNARESLTYWVNYVHRHKDVSHLKTVGAQMPFYQYLLLDVILFLVVTFILMLYIVYIGIKLSTPVIKRSFTRNKICKWKKSRDECD